MHMVGHYDVPAKRPTVSIRSCAPFVDENFGNIIASEKWLSITSARCNKINWRIDPDALESSQVLVHKVVVAEGVDVGNLTTVSRTRSRGQRPRLHR